MSRRARWRRAPWLPVIGVPLASSELKVIDALYSIAQMPPGMPVATVAVAAFVVRARCAASSAKPRKSSHAASNRRATGRSA